MLKIKGIQAGTKIKKLRSISFTPDGHKGVFFEVSIYMLTAPVAINAGNVKKIVM